MRRRWFRAAGGGAPPPPARYDFRAGLPAGVTASRTGDRIFARSSASAGAWVTTPEVREDRGDGRGGGCWTFPAYTNEAPPFDFSSPGWEHFGNVQHQADVGAGPGGVELADRLIDQSATGLGRVRKRAATGTTTLNVASVFVKDHVQPTKEGLVSGRDGGQPTLLGTGATWRRAEAAYAKSGQSLPPECFLFVAGQNVVTDVAETGEIDVWGAQAAAVDGLVPLVDGSTGALTMQLDSGEMAGLVAGNRFHWSGNWQLEGLAPFNGAPSTGNLYLFKAVTPDGEISLRLVFQTVMTVRINGADLHNPNFRALNYPGGEARWELWSLDSGRGLNLWINGARYAGENEVRGVPIAVSTPTEFWIGSNGDSNILPRVHTEIDVHDGRDPERLEGMFFGDSLTQWYESQLAVPPFVYSLDERWTRDGIGYLADAGWRVDMLLAEWLTKPQRGQAYMRWFVILAGVNDIVADESAAQIIGELQDLVDDMNTQHPAAHVLLYPLLPARDYLGETRYAVWQAVNEAIAGQGSTPITGSNLFRGAAWTEQDDGDGSLKAEYWSPVSNDGLHTNTAERQYRAGVIRADLQGLGLL